MHSLDLPFLAGGGEMGARIRAHDWSRTPLGPAAAWPDALKTLVGLLLASNQPMYLAWGPGRAFLYNDHYAPFLGMKHPDALGRDLLAEVWPEIRDALQPLVETTLSGEAVHVPEMALTLKRHGYPEQTWFAFSFMPVRDGDATVAGLFGVCTDLTDQKRAEQALATSADRHRGVLANMDEAFVLFDREFHIVDINAGTERLTGMDAGTLLGAVHWELFPGTFDSELGAMYRRVLAREEPEAIEFFYTFADGRSSWFEIRAYPVRDGLAVFFRDISARRMVAESASLASERVQLALDAGAIVGTWVWSVPDDHFIADERFAQRFGLSPERCREGLLLDEVTASIHPDDLGRVQEAIAEAMGRGGPYRCEYRVRQQDGTYGWVEANGRVELDDEGRPLRFPGVLMDHAVRRRAEEERDRANALLRNFIEAVPGVVYAKDLEGRLIIGNRGVSTLLGLPQEAYIGRTDREVLADPVQAEAVMATDRRIMESGQAEQVEEFIQYADGSPGWWLSTKAPMRDDAGRVVGLMGASLDITDRKRIEAALRLSEQRSALAMEASQLGAWTWDRADARVRLDARTARVCGVADGTAVTLAQVRGRLHAQDRRRVAAALRAALSGRGEGRFNEEFRLVHDDGSVAWAMARAQVGFELRGERRRAARIVGTVFDVTERRRMIEMLEQADRRKDEFLAMLAHELRNPLAPIGTAAQLLRMAPGEPSRVSQAAQIISRQVAHMTEMVDDLLDVSRVTRGLVELEREPVDLRGVVAAAAEQAEPVLRARRHEVLTSAPPAPAMVLGDRHRLVQVVSNLLQNAAKYTPQGGRIALKLGMTEQQVEIRITDNGIGMDEALVPHVFDLFTQGERTPDRSQGGLGIGLALVRSIVQLHGGRVSASSPGPGMGSTFTISLPRAVSIELPPVEAPAHWPRTPVRRRVLVVDDNRDAADTLADVLRMLGHDVAVAADGREALRLAEGRADWDAFILDIGMPDMTGHELARRLRRLVGGRAVRFIALTGYGQGRDQQESREAGFHHHLVKPADVADLQDLLAQEPPDTSAGAGRAAAGDAPGPASRAQADADPMRGA